MDLLRLHFRALLLRDGFACHELGARHATGEGVRKDERAAARWYRRGARLGDADSQWDLGYMLLLGEGAPADPEQAVDWLCRAAHAGHCQAPRLLADLYEKGDHGVSRDATEAERWKRFVSLQ